jgi:hypothetical protein
MCAPPAAVTSDEPHPIQIVAAVELHPGLGDLDGDAAQEVGPADPDGLFGRVRL